MTHRVKNIVNPTKWKALLLTTFADIEKGIPFSHSISVWLIKQIVITLLKGQTLNICSWYQPKRQGLQVWSQLCPNTISLTDHNEKPAGKPKIKLWCIVCYKFIVLWLLHWKQLYTKLYWNQFGQIQLDTDLSDIFDHFHLWHKGIMEPRISMLRTLWTYTMFG